MTSGRFVSRAGEKLQYAIDQFSIQVEGKVCADFGSSTGGFTDCLIQNGAAIVYSIDTSYGALDWNLRNNEKVIVMERSNAMHIVLPQKADIITIDTGWTRQEKVLPNALSNLKNTGAIITLIKPHYEAPPRHINKGKLEDSMVAPVMEDVLIRIKKLPLKVEKVIKSPLSGSKAANEEFLALILPV